LKEREKSLEGSKFKIETLTVWAGEDQITRPQRSLKCYTIPGIFKKQSYWSAKLTRSCLDDPAAKFFRTESPCYSNEPEIELMATRIKLLLEECQQHADCPTRGSPLLPSRAIDVELNNDPTVKLHLTTLGEIAPYVAW